MPYIVTVSRPEPHPSGNPEIVQIYEQQVEALDLQRVIAAVNHKPRVRKAKAAKATP